MKGREGRRERLHKLLDLARLYRGWSRSQLARALNRDVSSIYTSSDDPKVSLVMALADVLEWPVDTVVEFIFCGIETGLTEQPADPGGGEFAEAYEAAQNAYKTGQYREVLNMSRRLQAIAHNPVNRAKAYNVEASAWEALGRFTKAKRSFQQALFQSPLPIDLRFVFLGNLANAHYSLWELEAASGIASRILEWYDDNPARSPKQRICQAYALYVCGHALRRQIVLEPEQAERHAQRAADYLAKATESFSHLAGELGRTDLAAVGHTCKGGSIEVQVALGNQEALSALKEIQAELSSVSDESDLPTGPWLESYGWWSIFGANIALRHTGGDKRQHYLAVFTNKALDIAERLHNVGFDASCWMLEFQRQQATASDGSLPPLVLDGDDVRRIVGAAGDVPWFRPAAFTLLRATYIIDQTGRVIGSAPAAPRLLDAAGLPKAS